jgi:hypothetical protein
MSVFKIVQHLPSVSTTDTTDTQSTAFAVNTGVVRFAVDPSKGPATIEIGSNPSATSSSLLVHEGTEILIKGGHVKRSQITSITQGASTTILNVSNSIGTPAHAFVVGDYVTLTGSSVAAYNSGVAHLAVTAVTDTSISVALNSSGYAAFTGTATLSNSFKYAVKATGEGGALVYATEVQIVGG